MDPAAKSPTRLHRVLHAATHPIASCGYLVLMLLPLLIAGCYNHPSSDDFSNSVWTNFWAYQKHLYFNLTGRFFSSLIISLDPIHWGSFGGYQLEANVLIVVFAVSFAATMSALLRRFTDQPFRLRLFLAVVTTGVLFNGAPSLSQGFYWLTGSMTYTLPVLMLCWATLIGLRLERRPETAPIPLLLLQGLLIAGATGCNEVIIALPGALVFGMMLYHRRAGQRRLQRWYSGMLIIWAVVAAIAILAPGNYVRQSLQSRENATLLPAWLYFSKDTFLEWISEPVFLAYSMLYIALACRYRAKLPLRTLPSLLLSLAVIAIIFFPACWALGRMPPWRVKNVGYMAFLPAWMLVLAGIANGLHRFAVQRADLWPYLRSALSVVGVLLLLTQFRIDTLRGSSNYWMLAKNFRKKTLVNFDAEQLARYALIRATSADSLAVPKLRHLESNMVYFADLGPDPDKFPNVGAAKFFGKRKISLLPDSLMVP